MQEDGHGWVVGRDKTFLYTDNYGEIWQYGLIEEITSYNNDLVSVAIIPGTAAQEVLVATTNFNVLRTSDGGETWTEVLNGGSSGFMEQLQMVNDQTVFAFGKDFHRSTDGGITWETTDLSDTLYSSRGFFLSEQIGWFAEYGNAGGNIFKTTDAGQTWMQLSNQEIPFVRALYFFDEQHGLMMDASYLYESLDGGASWTALNANPIAASAGLFVLDEDHLLTVNSSLGSIYYSEDGGYTWQTMVGGASSLNACTGLPDGRLWTVGKYTTILKSEANGENWVDQIGGTKRSLNELVFVDEFTGFALSNALLRTTDGGAVWENITASLPVSPEVSTIRQMYAEAPAKIWLVYQNGQIAFSDNAGSDWEILAQIDSGNYSEFLRTGPGTLHLLNFSGALWRSDNDGDTWTQEATFPLGSYYDMAFTTAEKGWICGHEVLYQTTDGGSNWTLVALNNPSTFKTLAFASEQKGFLVPNFQGTDSLYVTEDGGLSWEARAPLPMGSYVSDMAFADENLGWAVGGSTGFGQVIQTTDGGDTWESTIPTVEHPALSAVSIPLPGEELAWTSGEGGIILKWVTCSEEVPVLTEITSDASVFCIGDTISFALSYENVDIFDWELPSDWFILGNTNTAQIDVLVGAESGSVIATGMNTCDDEASLSLQVPTPLSAPATPVLSFDEVLLSTDGTENSYIWFLNGEAILGENGASLMPENSGIYTVQAVNQNGCVSAMSNTVEVIIEGVWGLSANVGVLEIAPNPATDNFTLSHLPKGKKATLYLYDVYGKSYLQREFSCSSSVLIELPDHKAGLYLLRVEIDGRLLVGKVVLQ